MESRRAGVAADEVAAQAAERAAVEVGVLVRLLSLRTRASKIFHLILRFVLQGVQTVWRSGILSAGMLTTSELYQKLNALVN